MTDWIRMKTKDARRMCLSMYVGSECKFCKHTFDSVEDIENRELVCAENSGDGLKFACKECFTNQNNGGKD